jgi:hypothetical protein
MKKLLVALLSLVLVFAVVASVSAAAPTVTGQLKFQAYEDLQPLPKDSNWDKTYFDGRLFFNGDIDAQTNYFVSLQYTSDTTKGNDADFKVREAYATYKTSVGNFTFGKIRVTPSIIDLLDGVNPLTGGGITASNFVVKYGYNFDDNTNVGLTVVPTKSSGVEGGAFVAEAHTKASIFDLGLNYQYEGKGDAGYAFQASTTLFDSLSVWTEIGRLSDQGKTLTSDQKEAYYLGAAYTIGKFTFEAERQFNDDSALDGADQWGSKIAYAPTKNLSFELYHSSNYFLGNLHGKNLFQTVVRF